MLRSYEILTDISCFTIYLSSNMNDKIEMYQKLYTYGIFRLSSPGLNKNQLYLTPHNTFYSFGIYLPCILVCFQQK